MTVTSRNAASLERNGYPVQLFFLRPSTIDLLLTLVFSWFVILISSPAPQPYSFGYENTDEFGTQLFQSEQGDANNAKTGSYGFRDANGLFLTIRYVADANGFRAMVDTNEPGTLPAASADAVFHANAVVAPAGAQFQPGRYAGARPGGFSGGAAFGA
ncbi:hypothetical protein HPB48_022968 [Haemaphysalis longicornis]|uniref:Cuticle protein n=1 Tax=Haemaphysalis longicornis TaxID=44386 RepID=A0A9J6GA27_HAELO|nr:hypothetical protein HPB48_022968 [Haemaphysalis longicornis]